MAPENADIWLCEMLKTKSSSLPSMQRVFQTLRNERAVVNNLRWSDLAPATKPLPARLSAKILKPIQIRKVQSSENLRKNA